MDRIWLQAHVFLLPFGKHMPACFGKWGVGVRGWVDMHQYPVANTLLHLACTFCTLAPAFAVQVKQNGGDLEQKQRRGGGDI